LGGTYGIEEPFSGCTFDFEDNMIKETIPTCRVGMLCKSDYKRGGVSLVIAQVYVEITDYDVPQLGRKTWRWRCEAGVPYLEIYVYDNCHGLRIASLWFFHLI
jgi:hypothetical protein